ncbi:MAG: alpha/beta hydrolase, partial [Caldilineaceae bacterium]|nr:alpha/beta hydrolase [Caldilineaceae bacterium]
ATAKLHDPYRYAGYYQEIMLPAFRRLDPALAIDLPLETLATWQMPVCIIHGAEDEFFPLSIVEAMAAALPDHFLHVIADQPHALIFRQPWRVQEIMLTFLREQQ